MSSTLFIHLGGIIVNLPQIPDIFNEFQELSGTNEILKLNETLKDNNLVLNKKDAEDIIKNRSIVLNQHGRIELNSSVTECIVKQIGKSPYIDQNNLVETINDMYEIFHYIKNFTSDLLPDEETVEAMMFFYNKVYNGSIELLKGKGSEMIISNFKNNKDLKNTKAEEDDEL